MIGEKNLKDICTAIDLLATTTMALTPRWQIWRHAHARRQVPVRDNPALHNPAWLWPTQAVWRPVTFHELPSWTPPPGDDPPRPLGRATRPGLLARLWVFWYTLFLIALFAMLGERGRHTWSWLFKSSAATRDPRH